MKHIYWYLPFLFILSMSSSTFLQSQTIPYKVVSPLITQASFGKIATKTDSTFVVAYMPPAIEFNFYLDVGKGIRSVAASKDHNTYMLAPQSDNPGLQMKMLKEVIRRKVDAVILASHDPRSVAPLVKEAVDLGIVVVIVNSDTAEFSSPVHAIVGYKQRKGTQKLGDFVLSLATKDTSKVGIIEGAPGYHTNERVGGFLDAIKGSNLEVVSSLNGKWNTEGGNKAALEMFKSHPDITTVFAANDFEIIGVASALRTLGIDNVTLLGNDGDPAALKRIDEGKITATVNTNPVLIGQTAMQVTLDSLSRKFTGGFVETPTVIVDKNNVHKYWNPPRAVEGANFSEIRVVSESLPDLVNEDGSGLYMDILHEIYSSKGIKVKLQIAPFARTELMVKNKLADVMLGAYRGEIDEVIFPQWHYSENIISVIYKNNTLTQWQGQNSLSGKRLLWVRKYNYDKYLLVPVKKNVHHNKRSMLGMLQKDRVDFILDNEFSLRKELKNSKQFLNSNDFYQKDYQIKELMRLKLYLAFAYTNKGDEFSKIFDDEFAQLLASGKLETLFNKWDTPFPFSQ